MLDYASRNTKIVIKKRHQFLSTKTWRVDPHKYIIWIFIGLFMFRMPKKPCIPNFKLKGQISKFRKNRRVNLRVHVVWFFIADSCSGGFKASISDFWISLFSNQLEAHLKFFFKKPRVVWKNLLSQIFNCLSAICVKCHQKPKSRNMEKYVGGLQGADTNSCFLVHREPEAKKKRLEIGFG